MNTRRYVAAAVVGAALVLTGTGCASGSPSGPPSLTTVANTVGATGLQTEQPAMYERAEGLATLNGQNVQIVTFNNADAKTAWRHVAEAFGTSVIKSGPLWIVATI